MLALHDWQNFYMLTGTAAATLIGLLFVAISISVGTNLSLQQATNSLRTFVDPTLLYYVQALLVSCLTVMPISSSYILGVVLIVQGSIDIALTVKVYWRIIVVHRAETFDSRHWVWHIALPMLTGILYVCVAIGLFIGWQFALVGLSLAVLLCLAIGLHNTWILTIWLILHREAFQQTQNEQQTTTKDAIRR